LLSSISTASLADVRPGVIPSQHGGRQGIPFNQRYSNSRIGIIVAVGEGDRNGRVGVPICCDVEQDKSIATRHIWSIATASIWFQVPARFKVGTRVCLTLLLCKSPNSCFSLSSVRLRASNSISFPGIVRESISRIVLQVAHKHGRELAGVSPSSNPVIRGLGPSVFAKCNETPRRVLSRTQLAPLSHFPSTKSGFATAE
jgi:hypothetical protein